MSELLDQEKLEKVVERFSHSLGVVTEEIAVAFSNFGKAFLKVRDALGEFMETEEYQKLLKKQRSRAKYERMMQRKQRKRK